MCYWLIPNYGKQIADTTIQNVTSEYPMNPEIKKAIDQYEKDLRQILDYTNFKVEAVGSG